MSMTPDQIEEWIDWHRKKTHAWVNEFRRDHSNRLKALEERVENQVNHCMSFGDGVGSRFVALEEKVERLQVTYDDMHGIVEKPPTCGGCAEFDDDGCVDHGVRDKDGPPRAFSCFRPKEQKADKCNCPTANVNKQEAKPPTGGECMDNVDELEERADAGDDLRKRIGWLEDRLEEHTMKLHLKPPTCGQCGYSTPEGLGCTVPGCVNKSRFKPKESKEEKCNCWNGNVNKQEGKLTNWGGGDEWVLSPGPGMLPQWVITHCPWCGKKL